MAVHEAVRALGRELSNWGRWGAEDEKGCFNHITPEKIVEAGKLIRSGKIFSLSLPLDLDGPQDVRRTGRMNPVHRMIRYGGEGAYGHKMGEFCSADDTALLDLQSSTQWDALSHLWYDDTLYNGFPASSITAHGAAHCAVGAWKAGVVSRGVLLDIAAHIGVSHLEPDFAITPEMLDATEAAQGVKVEAGDVVLIRTGLIGAWRRGEATLDRQPGLAFQCARWLHERDVAAVCADNSAVEVLQQPDGLPLCSFHMVALRDMGLMLGELYLLDELAADCAADGVYAFFFTAAPLPFPRAVGSPVNPLAIK